MPFGFSVALLRGTWKRSGCVRHKGAALEGVRGSAVE